MMEGKSPLTPHPNWQSGWQVVPGALPYPLGWSVVARDSSGGLIGFTVQAGWPEMGEEMCHALLALLADADPANHPRRKQAS